MGASADARRPAEGRRPNAGSSRSTYRQEFSIGAWQGGGAEVSVEEIVNAMGFDGYHDGVNYMRAVCVLVLEKAKGSFEQSLAKLRLRLLHVMRRLAPLVDAMLRAQVPLDIVR